MKFIASILVVLIATLSLQGCSTTTKALGGLAASSAQTILSPYSFQVDGEAKGELGVNSQFLAIDAHVSVEATYRAPVVLGAPSEVVWRKSFERGEGQRAYEIRFGIVEGAKFIQVFSVPWEAARAAMPWLSPATGPVSDGPPAAVTPKIIVEEPPAEPVAVLPHVDGLSLQHAERFVPQHADRFRPPEVSTA